MTTPHFSRYLSAWQTHADGSEQTTAAMISAASPDMTYDDINVGQPWVGADGLRTMNHIAEQTFSTLTMTVRNQVSSDTSWAITWDAEGVHAPTQKPVTFRGASFGTFDADGRVQSHTDFWNLGQLVAQLETSPS